MMKRLLTVCVLLVTPALASAQTGATVQQRVQFYQNGAILPAQVMTVTTWVCGQPKILPPPPPAIVYINTTASVRWDDPASPTTLDCAAAQGPGGTLLSLPTGPGYSATATAVDDRGTVGDPSAMSNPFTRGVPPKPPAATGVRVLP